MPLSTKNEIELWKEYSKTKDKEIRDILIIKYIPLVKYIASRLSITKNAFECDDLVSYGIFGLIEAIDRYDHKKGIKFHTYAYSRIKGAIIDGIRKSDWIPQTVRKKAKWLEEQYRIVEQKLGRFPTDEDLCNELSMDQNDLNYLLQEISKLNLISFDNLVESQFGTLQENSPELHVERKEVETILANSIDKLPKKEKLVITLYYYEGLTFIEISKVMGITQSRVSQLHSKGILRLRGGLSKRKKTLL